MQLKKRVIKTAREHRARMNFLFGQIGNELGRSAEQRVNEGFEHAKNAGRLPLWIKSWVRVEQYSEDDKKGIDFYFETDVGQIPLQVKSSRRRAALFSANHGDEIAIVVVDVRHPPTRTFGRTIIAIGTRRKDILRKRHLAAQSELK